jgi:DNA polymerase-3 subunit gamma/tau
LEGIGRVSQFARSYFMEAHPVSFTKNVLTIGFDPEFAEHISMVDNSKNHSIISTKLSELGFHGAQVKIVRAERPDGFTAPEVAGATAEPAPAPSVTPMQSAPASAPAQPAPAKAVAAKPVQLDPAEFKNDPLIKKALEMFRGTIVEVRA